MLIEPHSLDDLDFSLKLSDRLRGYLLALVHVAAIIRRKTLTLNEMFELFGGDSFSSELQSSIGFSVHDKYAHTLSTVWKLEYFEEEREAVQLLGVIVF